MNLIVKLLLIAFLLSFRPAAAQEVEVGRGLVCDTQAEVESFVKLSNEGKTNAAAIQAINGDTVACDIIPVAFIRGNTLGKVRTKNGPAEIVNILVVAAFDGQRWNHVRPVPQVTLFFVKGEEA